MASRYGAIADCGGVGNTGCIEYDLSSIFAAILLYTLCCMDALVMAMISINVET